MKTILDGIFLKKNGKRGKVNPVFSLVFYVFLGITIVLSIIAAVMSTKGVINKSLFVYKFDVREESGTIASGTPVSINWNGQLVKGGGYGIYRKASSTTPAELTNVKIQTIKDHVVVAVYNNQAIYMYIDMQEEGIVQKDDNMKIDITGVNKFIQLTDSDFVVCSDIAFQPIRVTFTKVGKVVQYASSKGSILNPFGGDAPKGIDYKYARADNLDNTTIAFTYERTTTVSEFEDVTTKAIMGNIARWRNDGDRFSLVLGSSPTEMDPEAIYQYHAVAGMSSMHFVLAANGRRNNGTVSEEWEPMPMRMKLVTVDGDKLVPQEEWTMRAFSDSTSWFAADNFPFRQSGLIAYYSDVRHGGVVALEFSVRSRMVAAKPEYYVSWGPSLVCENGGAATTSQRIALRMLSFRLFGLVFPDENSNGNLVHMMGELTDNGDLIRVGPNLSLKRHRPGYGPFHFDLDALDRNGHYVIVDSYTANGEAYFGMSYGFNMGRPMGIAVSRTGKKNNVQFSGVYTYPKSKNLNPGKVYYTNSKGDLVEGSRMFGADNVEHGNFYYSDSTQILSLHNQIGVAVSTRDLLIRLR